LPPRPHLPPFLPMTREEMNASSVWSFRKARYEWMVEQTFETFDVIDLHAYVPIVSFLEGEIAYLSDLMARFGEPKPIWIIEGGGPHKNYPGYPAINSPADPFFGWGSAEENAEFVVKLHAISAAMGVERQHWGLGGTKGENAYWDGPWCGMGLLDRNDDHRKPSYYAFRTMVELLDGFTEAVDVSSGSVRAFRFTVDGEAVHVLWTDDETERPIDASPILGEAVVLVTRIVTELDEALAPIVPPARVAPTAAVPLSHTPVFVRRP